MKVNPIYSTVSFGTNSRNAKKRLNRYSLVPATGYTALGLGVASAAFAHQKMVTTHKVTAMAALVAAFAHVGLLHYNHKKS